MLRGIRHHDERYESTELTKDTKEMRERNDQERQN